MALVAGPVADDPKVAEAVLAHEMLHGLDDQKFGIFAKSKRLARGPSDRAVAYAAVVEGNAKLIERSYAEKHDAEADFGGGAGAEEAAKDLPFALLLQVAFTYEQGAEFVETLVERGKGFELVNEALGERPPVSSAQVIHPELYMQNRAPEAVRVSPGPVLGSGWSRLDSTGFGELEVLQLLVLEEDQLSEYQDAAEGWAGGRVELWRQGKFDPQACRAPCRKRDAAVFAVRWMGDQDAQEFEKAFRSSLEANQGAQPAGDGAFRLEGGAGAAVGSRGKDTTVAYAPTPALAKQLASRAGP